MSNLVKVRYNVSMAGTSFMISAGHEDFIPQEKAVNLAAVGYVTILDPGEASAEKREKAVRPQKSEKR